MLSLPLSAAASRFPRASPLLVVLVAVAVTLAACGGPPFDPAGPCTVDGQEPGAYPALEAAIPERFDGRGPDTLDSGRSCTPETLGPLAGHGVGELRFAGGVWRFDARSGATLALFEAPGLEPAWMAEFYEAGARAARETEEIVAEPRTIGGTDVLAIETLNDESFQTIAVLDETGPGPVRVVLVGSDVREIETREAHAERVAAAVEAWAAEP